MTGESKAMLRLGAWMFAGAIAAAIVWAALVTTIVLVTRLFGIPQ